MTKDDVRSGIFSAMSRLEDTLNEIYNCENEEVKILYDEVDEIYDDLLFLYRKLGHDNHLPRGVTNHE
jgi:hypothetical protein